MKMPGGTARNGTVGLAGGESVYLPDDVHWKATGHRVVAAAVAARIQQMGEPAAIDAGNQR